MDSHVIVLTSYANLQGTHVGPQPMTTWLVKGYGGCTVCYNNMFLFMFGGNNWDELLNL
jgi:hypothetical protein